MGWDVPAALRGRVCCAGRAAEPARSSLAYAQEPWWLVDYPPGPARGQVRYAEAALSDQILQVRPPPKWLQHASDGCQHLKLRRAERDAVWLTGEEAQTRSRHVFL
jgi:hypothetical protein